MINQPLGAGGCPALQPTGQESENKVLIAYIRTVDAGVRMKAAQQAAIAAEDVWMRREAASATGIP